MKNILIVEDDREINNILKEFLMNFDYNIIQVFDGVEAVREFDINAVHMVLLDLMLPYKSGDQVLKYIRKKSNIPILVISAKDIVGVKVDLFNLGADDYIIKPFDLDEVAARVESNFRRYNISQNIITELKFKDIILNEENKTVYINDKQIDFTSKEYSILALLMQYPEKIFSKKNLFESVWEDRYYGEENTLNVHLSKLRKKLSEYGSEEEYIETLWGMGYRLKK